MLEVEYEPLGIESSGLLSHDLDEVVIDGLEIDTCTRREGVSIHMV